MKRIEHAITVSSRTDPVTIYFLSDLHLGHAAANETAISAAVKEIEESGAYWIGLGDIVDAIGRQDGRYREGLLAKWLYGCTTIWREQRRHAAELLRPIATQCLAYLTGNHEEYVRTAGIDVYYSLAEEAGIAPDRCLGMSGFIVLKLRRGDHGGTRTVVIFAHHGWGGGELLGSQALKLERLPGRYQADIYAIGHGHRALYTTQYMETAYGPRRIVLLEAPGFMGKYADDEATYGERRAFTASPAGAPAVVVYADSKGTVEVKL